MPVRRRLKKFSSSRFNDWSHLLCYTWRVPFVTRQIVSTHFAPTENITRRFSMRDVRRTFSRASLPTFFELSCALLSAALLILAFPDFNLWFLAWFAFVPWLFALAHRQSGATAFLLGWTCGAVFFYGSCYWLTHAMIQYGGIPAWLAYLLLAPATLIVGLFPALFAAIFARLCRRFGTSRALVIAPLVWTATEWLRFEATGQLWNAVGYSQAFHPDLIQAARWGGVYAIGFFIFAFNAALTAIVFGFLRARQTRRQFIFALIGLIVVVFAVVAQRAPRDASLCAAFDANAPRAIIIAVQPNVPVDFKRTEQERDALLRQHLASSLRGLNDAEAKLRVPSVSENSSAALNPSLAVPEANQNLPLAFEALPRIVVFPESPANFSYAYDARFREAIENFTRANHVSLIFNSLEPASDEGYTNAALLLDEEGRKTGQYAKIHLVPFGEYMPLPKWLPLTWLLGAIVGDFTPGANYTLMPLGEMKNAPNETADKRTLRAGVSICVESAYPDVAGAFAQDGADFFINITNDGYLGRTAVLRQHLANGVFRAVENERPFLSVTNTGISAYISPHGEVLDETASYETDVREWTITGAGDGKTFYTRHGDVFPVVCVGLNVFLLLMTRRRKLEIEK